MKIYCPGCEWEPKPSSLWMCEPRCGHHWNTFDTGGVCPACSKIWKQTQCLSCHRRYPHPDWYHDDADADLDLELDLDLDVEVEARLEVDSGSRSGS